MELTAINVMETATEYVKALNNMYKSEEQNLLFILRVDEYPTYEEILNYIVNNYDCEYKTSKLYNDDLDGYENYYVVTEIKMNIEGKVIVLSLGSIPELYYNYYTEDILDFIYGGQKNHTLAITLYSKFIYDFSKEE